MAVEQEQEQQNYPFVEEPGITDVALVVEEKKLFVNKFILAVASPVFKTMFTSDFKEKETSEVELPGKKYEDVLEFLLCIYPNILKPLSLKTINQVLPLMHEYDCKRQVEECNAFLVKMVDPGKPDITVDKLLLCLSQTHMALLSESYQKCLDSVSRCRSDSIMSSKEFIKLSPEIKEQLYIKRIQKLENTGDSVVKQLRYRGQLPEHVEYQNFADLMKK